MNYETLEVKNEDSLQWVTLNRPDALNAMNRQLVGDLHDLLDALHDDTRTRVVVLRGAGRGFCAGLDLKESAGGGNGDGSVSSGLRGQRRIAEQDRDDGVARPEKLESGVSHGCPKVTGIGVQPFPEVTSIAGQIQGHRCTPEKGRSNRVGEQIGPSTLAEQINDLTTGGDETAHAATQRLSQRAGDDVDPVGDAL